MNEAARGALLAWYDAGRRKLPWRERPSPYRTWVSEIMLQQTQVATVIPYYERFLARFPDARSLARASETAVLKYWAGLGYYSRARNLRRAAQVIVDRHGGEFPSAFDEILALPGVGRYTAGAIASIAFGKPEPLVDGNVARVFARLYAIAWDVKSARVQEDLWDRAARLVPRDRPGDWNQALMELGALVCVPEGPRCGECPVARACAARRRGIEDRLPVRTAGKPPIDVAWTALRIEREGKLLLWRRADDERLLPGHWGLPEARHLKGKARPDGPARVVRHSITHHRITVEVRRANLVGVAPEPARWVRRQDLDDYLVSSLWRKAAGAGTP